MRSPSSHRWRTSSPADIDDLLATIDEGTRADGRAFTFNGQPLPSLSGLAVRDIEMNIGQQFLHLLSDPNIAFILFTIGFYGILAELFHPNFFSGILGAIAIVLAFIGSNSLPLNVGGLLLDPHRHRAVRARGHRHELRPADDRRPRGVRARRLRTVDRGRPGIDRIAEVTVSPWLVLVVVAVGLVYIGVLMRALLQMRRNAPSGDRVMPALVGAAGTAETLIAPTGIAYAGGESWSARSQGGAEIGVGAPLRVVGVEGLELIVEPASAGDGGATEG